MAAELLIDQGHQVVLHARNVNRAQDAQDSVSCTAEVNALGRFDVAIHKAGVYRGSGKEIFAANTLKFVTTAKDFQQFQSRKPKCQSRYKF